MKYKIDEGIIFKYLLKYFVILFQNYDNIVVEERRR